MSLFRAALSTRSRGGRPVARRRTTAAAGLAGAVLAVDALVGSGAASAATPNDFQRLAQCESGGNFSINTGNGYYGAYQFSLATWRSLGYGGYPHQASPEVQTQAAAELQERSGWGQWPACSRKLGLNSRRGLEAPLAPPAPLSAIDQLHQGNAEVKHILGAPLGPEFPVNGGVVKLFQGGQITWSGATGAHAVYGEILKAYARTGWEQGRLGFARSSEQAIPGGRENLFDRGRIVWSPTTGAHVLEGFIRARYEALGGSAGALGFPIGGERPEAGGVSQAFTGGEVFFDAETGATTELSGQALAAYRAAGGPGGKLGMPVRTAQTAAGTEVILEGGTITAQPDRSAASVVLS